MNGYMRHGAVLIMIDITCVGGTFLRRSVPAEEHQRTGGGVAVTFIKTILFIDAISPEQAIIPPPRTHSNPSSAVSVVFVSVALRRRVQQTDPREQRHAAAAAGVSGGAGSEGAVLQSKMASDEIASPFISLLHISMHVF